MVNGKTENIKIDGHIGTWYIIAEDYDEYLGYGTYGKIYLLEHETYGDEAASLIVDREGNILLDSVWNGFNDYWEMMEG